MKGLPRISALKQVSRPTWAPKRPTCTSLRRPQSTSSAGLRTWSTPLAENIGKAISTTGPITVANYMRQCLTSPEGGYYTREYAPGLDPFGVKGDFITAPEISQIFGELVGLWVVAEWMAQGRNGSGVQLLELGPGRGTLMDDMLRTIQSFPRLATAIDSVYLVEASPMLREKQHQLLCDHNTLEQTDYGFSSTSKYAKNLRIHWLSELSTLPPLTRNESPFVIAHEFFDALPIHVFKSIPPPSIIANSSGHSSSSNQWRELLVSIAPQTLSLPSAALTSRGASNNVPDFALTQATHPTPHSVLLPTLLSPRYSNLLSLPAGSTIEISPDSISITELISKRIGEAGSGGALIIDYGPPSSTTSSQSPVPANTLRGILSHELVSPFAGAGNVDLSASVDFGALAAAALAASTQVEVHGHIPQAHFLKRLGGAERSEILANQTTQLSSSEDGGARIKKGWERLVDEGIRGMGKLYQAMAIVPEGRGRRGGVVGFGGDLV